ncbi:DUF982 domain-containing protein [Rhizobium aegyptiacum]|uniref:DUF982 domain-containing protein n=1 Tax=Rhizobium aegyptiacum TaxID=1764550 RepID=UPI001FDA1978|nr:DUF982 domain-containing protein [Rhizobium aegyptiacum]
MFNVAMRAPDTIRNTGEARIPCQEWKGSKKRYRFAKEICSAALLGRLSDQTAQEAFVQAVSEARMITCAPNAPLGAAPGDTSTSSHQATDDYSLEDR